MDKKMILEFDVVKQCLIRRDKNNPVANSVNYLYAKFKFSNDYDNLIKKAIFSNNNDLNIEVTIDDSNMCIVPPDAIVSPTMWVTVKGCNKDNEEEVIIPTNKERVGIGETNVGTNTEQSIKYVNSETLNVEKVVDRINIEIPNTYGVELKYNNENGKLELLGRKDNKTQEKVVLSEIDLPTEKVVEKVELNKDTGDLVFTFVGGGESKVNLGDGGKAIIDVDTLPKEEIKKSIIYRTPDTKLHQWGKTIETVVQEGVAISNTEYVDKIYFNTNLKLDDIVTQLSKLTYIYDDSGIGKCPVFAGTSTNKQIVVMDYSAMGFGYLIGDVSNVEASTESAYFISSASFSTTVGAGFVGWNPFYENNYVDVQDTPNVDYVNDINQNELIKNILSTVEIKTDTIEKEDFVEILTNNSYDVLSTTPGGRVGKLIESSENVFIEKIYFNKDMSVDAVVSALASIENWTGGMSYPVFSSSDETFMLMIGNYDALIPGYGMFIVAMVNSEEVVLFASSPQLYGFSGWNPDIENNYIEVNSYGAGAIEDSPAGIENDKLTSIFSANEDFKTVGISNKLVEFKEKGVPIYPKTNVKNVEGLNAILNSKQNALGSDYGVAINGGIIQTAAHYNIDSPDIYNEDIFNRIKQSLKKGFIVYVDTFDSAFRKEPIMMYIRGKVVSLEGWTDWDYLDLIDNFTIEYVVDGIVFRYKWYQSGSVTKYVTPIVTDSITGSDNIVTDKAVKNYAQPKITVTENEDGTVDITIPTGEES